MMKRFFNFFDKLEDKVRFTLSKSPILYALIGAIGIILVWKGVWEMAEYYPVLFGPASFILGTIILLFTGLLVSFFIGDSIILSGFKHEKKLAEKAEREIKSEMDLLQEISLRLGQVEKELRELKEKQNLIS